MSSREMMDNVEKKGIYIHIPFCKSKCMYCDFCSVVPDGDIVDRYVTALKKEALRYKRAERIKADTVYFGGGTPSFIGADRLADILCTIQDVFSIDSDAEITAECNPSSCDEEFFIRLKASGFNRISLGLQSASETERKAIGRLTDSKQAKEAVAKTQKAGFDNISLDLMLGLPDQTIDSLKDSIDFCAGAGVQHISAYILKAEEGTPFYDRLSTEGADSLNLPDEDSICDLYLFAAEYLEAKGFKQYEISNFAKDGLSSRHNTKYWNADEYIGLGASAHSFFEGKRFYNSRKIGEYLKGSEPFYDGPGGDFDEYAMLRLRLTDGINKDGSEQRFGNGLYERIRKNAERLNSPDLIKISDTAISLTKQGFLVSNALIAEMLG